MADFRKGDRVSVEGRVVSTGPMLSVQLSTGSITNPAPHHLTLIERPVVFEPGQEVTNDRGYDGEVLAVNSGWAWVFYETVGSPPLTESYSVIRARRSTFPWSDWYGGPQRPALDGDQLVEAKQREGGVISGKVSGLDWYARDRHDDIVAYRVITDSEECERISSLVERVA